MKPLFSACPHDVILDPEKWTAFTNYVVQKSKQDFEFKRFESFDTFAENFNTFSLVYAHPLHAVQLSRDKGYLPVAKYTEIYDEAVVISRKTISGNDIRQIEDRSVACIVGSPSHAALKIDMHRLKNEVEFDENHRDSYPKVLMAVSIGDCDFGIILKSVWDDMLTMKERVRVHYTTSSHSLVHVFMLAPQMKGDLEKYRKILTTMDKEPEGTKILARLKCPSLTAFSDQDLKTLQNHLSVCNYNIPKVA